MKKLLFIGTLTLTLAACATGPRPMMANGERCKEDYYSPTGVLMTCERQKRQASIEASEKLNRELIEFARQQVRETNERTGSSSRECDEIVISSSGEELCVIKQR